MEDRERKKNARQEAKRLFTRRNMLGIGSYWSVHNAKIITRFAEIANPAEVGFARQKGKVWYNQDTGRKGGGSNAMFLSKLRRVYGSGRKRAGKPMHLPGVLRCLQRLHGNPAGASNAGSSARYAASTGTLRRGARKRRLKQKKTEKAKTFSVLRSADRVTG